VQQLRRELAGQVEAGQVPGRNPRPPPHTPACPARPARRIIRTLRQYPATEDFVYLRQWQGASGSAACQHNPYALQVVPHAAIGGGDFATLSARGLTHYVGGGAAGFTGGWLPRRWWGGAGTAPGGWGWGWGWGCAGAGPPPPPASPR
jgi:hypothetical protein